MAQNRTLQVFGYAYGNAPVLLNAHINGTLAFSGEVPTIDSLPPDGIVLDQVLFSANTALFPTDFSGAYPVTISVANGNGVLIGDVHCNYMQSYSLRPNNPAIMDNSSIAGTTLTVGTLTSGVVEVGQILGGTGIVANTVIVSGSGSSWTVNNSQTVAPTTITGYGVDPVPGNATSFSECYVNSTPDNGTNPPDPRADVTVDGVNVPHPPVTPTTEGPCNYIIPPGSTLGFNLTVSLGSTV